MEYLVERTLSWMTIEPFIGILMIFCSVALFVSHYRKDQFQPTTFWQWLRRTGESTLLSITFLALLWAFRFLLNHNTENFALTHGRVSGANYNSVETIWGSPQEQRELSVIHYVEKEIEEEIPREDLTQPALFRKTKTEVLVEQNSILSSEGKADLKLNERKKGSAYYNGYELDFRITYSVRNFYSESTTASFFFPLSTQVMYDSLKITENGKDISTSCTVSYEGVRWKKIMAPDEVLQIEIGYRSRGLDYFYYQVPEPRQIKNSVFTIEVDKLPVSKINYPGNCLTPHQLNATPDGKGSILRWKLDNAITTSGMGVALEKPSQPGAQVSLVLRNSPYALMLLITTIILTLIIARSSIKFQEIALISAVYCLLFFSMASFSDYFFGFWGSLVAGNILTLSLTYLLYRKSDSSFLRISIYSLVAFFTLIYPISGLFPDIEKNFHGWVTIAITVYIFFISTRSAVNSRTS